MIYGVSRFRINYFCKTTVICILNLFFNTIFVGVLRLIIKKHVRRKKVKILLWLSLSDSIIEKSAVLDLESA